jgi:transcriptional regulator GlxA family with amidase domain
LPGFTARAEKGATTVSICNGSLVLANDCLTDGHQATGRWSKHGLRVAKFPDTHWLKNTRYVADGKIVSSAGITAALPFSIALVEATFFTNCPVRLTIAQRPIASRGKVPPFTRAMRYHFALRARWAPGTTSRAR